MTDKKWALEKALQAAKDYEALDYQDKIEDLILAAGKIEEYLQEESDSQRVSLIELRDFISDQVAISSSQNIAATLLLKYDIRKKS